VLWTAGGLAIAALLGVGAGVLWLRSAAKAALPVLDGDVHVAGLSAPVTVRRDGHGVPHIEAATQDDMLVAQGYVTAQDRLWQMDAYRRNANGELAEVMGPSLVERDRMQRVLEFKNTARRIYANLPAAERARLDDYARGVNLYIAQCEQSNTLPVEFRLLGYRPQPWSGADSVSVGLMMVQMLDSHWPTKYFRERVTADLKNPRLEEDLYPVGSWRDHPPTGVVLDLSQPHAEPAPSKSDGDDEDDDEPSTARLDLKGHGFSRAAIEPPANEGFSPGASAQARKDISSGTKEAKEKLGSRVKFGEDIPQGLKPITVFCRVCGTTEVVPFQSVRKAAGGASFSSGAKARSSYTGVLAQLKPRPFKTDRNVLAQDPEGAPPRPFKGGLWPEAAQVDPRAMLALLGLPTCDGCVPGSNDWVVAGTHTASGKPLLSNDMHLSLTVPNIWYMADLKAPGFHAAGVTLPGLPFVTEGHNDHVAWGMTALMGDVQDLYIEKLDGKGNYQDVDTTWKPLKVDHEVIHVRGGRDVALDVKLTAHGPLLNPILPKETRPIALKWTIYDPALNDLPVYQLDTAANWADFSAALAQWNWPTLNIVYADDQGHIAYHAVGKIPLRPTGLAGVPIGIGNSGSTAHEWQGYLPFDVLPNAVDPPSGFLATANSRVTWENFPAPLTLEWVDPYRIERIYKALEGRDGLTAKDMLAVQTDVYSEVDQEMGQRLAYAIDHADGTDERLRQAADLMRSWDGRVTTDSAAASIVGQARKALWGLILEPKLGKDAADYSWAESDFAEEEIVMHAKADWLPKDYKDWDALLTAAVRKGMKDGKAPGNVADWRYGSWHVVDLEHPLARFLPVVGKIAGTGPQPQSGDSTTVKATGRTFGPSQRFTMDWSNIDGSTEDIVLGESGDPYSAYFRDQWKDWYGGTTFALPFTPAAVAGAARHTLRLEP
jgi:acyl-homoserine lactone acylase PvdQ